MIAPITNAERKFFNIGEAIRTLATVKSREQNRRNSVEWLRRARVNLFEGKIDVARNCFDRAVDEMEAAYR